MGHRLLLPLQLASLIAALRSTSGRGDRTTSTQDTQSDDMCSLTWEQANFDGSATLSDLVISPVKTTVTAKKKSDGRFELDTVTTWTTMDELDPQVNHYLRLDPLIDGYLKNAPTAQTCQKQLIAWGRYIHDKGIVSRLSGESFAAGASDTNAALFIGLVPDVMAAKGMWEMKDQQHFSNAPPEADLFKGQTDSSLPAVRVAMWWNASRKRYEIASVIEEYKFLNDYLSESSRDSELKKMLNAITIPEGNPNRQCAAENLARYGSSCSNARGSGAKQTNLKLKSKADIGTKAIDSVLVILGYLTGWPDSLRSYNALE